MTMFAVSKSILNSQLGFIIMPSQHSSVVERLPGLTPILSPSNACSQVHSFSYHAGHQEVSRCHTRGESQETCNTYMPPPSVH